MIRIDNPSSWLVEKKTRLIIIESEWIASRDPTDFKHKQHLKVYWKLVVRQPKSERDAQKDISQKPWNLPTARFNSNWVLFVDPLKYSKKICLKNSRRPQGLSYDLLYDLCFGILKPRFSIFPQMLAKNNIMLS